MSQPGGLGNRLASLFGKTSIDAPLIWQDREIRFDLNARDLDCRKGEFVIGRLIGVEDTKANNEERGEMILTNLRMLWISERSKRTSMSIGYSCVSDVSIRSCVSRLRGASQSIYILTRFNGSRFEFIFSSIQSDFPRLYSSLQAIHAAYGSSKLYRDLKLRAALLEDSELILLPKEEVYHKVNGVWNLSSDQGNLGTFILTNVRVVWHANLAENFNISIPYMRIKGTRIRESKFGMALVIETTAESGGYILGFRIDPKEHMEGVHKEIQSLWKVYSQNPIFGVDFAPDAAGTESMFNSETMEDDVQIVDGDDKGDLFATYFAEDSKSSDRPPVFCNELGLAIESLKEGMTIAQCWKVV
ncbi:hypothetical protein BSKO_09367 [Bryopsis sp. KO-2023]|nr:hypothetical protein BSKO_09367 [Bryopsis sp. KO-2023]